MSNNVEDGHADREGGRQGRRGSPLIGLIGLQLRAMKPGDSVTFSKTITDIPNPRAAQDFSVLLSSYLARHRAGAKWKRESFTAFTYRGRPICGVVVTLLNSDEDAEIDVSGGAHGGPIEVTPIGPTVSSTSDPGESRR